MHKQPMKDYAAPLSTIDEVVQLDEGGIITRKRLNEDEPIFAGHYPGNPVFPGVLILEAVVQAARRHAETHHGPARLAEVVSVRFLSPMVPGQTLITQCRCERKDENALLVNGLCLNGETKVAKIRILLRLEDSRA